MDAAASKRAFEREKKRRIRMQAKKNDPNAPKMDEAEFMRCLEAAVRDGSVQAMRLWSDINRQNAEAKVSNFGEFLERRSA